MTAAQTGTLDTPAVVSPALTSDNVVGYLQTRGVLGSADGARARELGGGISNRVLRVDAPGGAVVVKQSLPRLRVAEPWEFDPRRVLVECACMRTLGSVLPAGSVPEVLDVDDERLAFTMTCAPPGGVVWKDALLSGQVDPLVARRAGRMLAAVHDAASRDPSIPARFADLMPLRQGRLDPYHHTAAAAHPDLAPRLEADVRRLTTHRRALVLGDWSPKNLIVYPDRVLALDFEVAHWGDPSFDTAFMLTHLAAKALHRPHQSAEYLEAARAFWGAYAVNDGASIASEADTAGELAILMLCRADGKSPLEYLSPAAQARLRGLARALILDEPGDAGGDGALETAWSAIAHAAEVS